MSKRRKTSDPRLVALQDQAAAAWDALSRTERRMTLAFHRWEKARKLVQSRERAVAKRRAELDAEQSAGHSPARSTQHEEER